MSRSRDKISPDQLRWTALATIAGAGLIWIFATSRFCTARVRYILRRREGAFEIRDYPDLAVAETPRPEAQNTAAFNRLHRYIQGANSTGRKIPMTAPVFLEKSDGQRSMAFIMPNEIPAPPEPRDPEVEINVRPAGRFAVLRYHGWPAWRNERKAIAILRRWLIDQGLPASADPIIAYYDPPWMPPPLRRNEILIQLPK